MIEINRASLTMALTLNQAQRGVAHRYTRDLGPGVSCIIIYVVKPSIFAFVADISRPQDVLQAMSSLENVPAAVLAEMPVGTPPPGKVPNFVDPPNSGTNFIIWNGILLWIMLGFFPIRIYSRLRIIRHLYMDDRRYVLILQPRTDCSHGCSDLLYHDGKKDQELQVQQGEEVNILAADIP